MARLYWKYYENYRVRITSINNWEITFSIDKFTPNMKSLNDYYVPFVSKLKVNTFFPLTLNQIKDFIKDYDLMKWTIIEDLHEHKNKILLENEEEDIFKDFEEWNNQSWFVLQEYSNLLILLNDNDWSSVFDFPFSTSPDSIYHNWDWTTTLINKSWDHVFIVDMKKWEILQEKRWFLTKIIWFNNWIDSEEFPHKCLLRFLEDWEYKFYDNKLNYISSWWPEKLKEMSSNIVHQDIYSGYNWKTIKILEWGTTNPYNTFFYILDNDNELEKCFKTNKNISERNFSFVYFFNEDWSHIISRNYVYVNWSYNSWTWVSQTIFFVKDLNSWKEFSLFSSKFEERSIIWVQVEWKIFFFYLDINDQKDFIINVFDENQNEILKMKIDNYSNSFHISWYYDEVIKRIKNLNK